MTTDRKHALLALLLLVPVPSIGTITGMVLAEGPVGSAVFFALKFWLFGLPLFWLVVIDKRRPRLPRPSAAGMPAGVVSGVLIASSIVAAYWCLGREVLDEQRMAAMRAKAEEFKLTTTWIYLVGALYWCTVNSILEEYVWRWFVFTRLEVLVPRIAAVILGGALFTVHHVIALDVYFRGVSVSIAGLDVGLVVLTSLGVFIGGVTWSWIYLRYRNIWAAYVSHVFADVVIFAIGWQLLIA